MSGSGPSVAARPPRSSPAGLLLVEGWGHSLALGEAGPIPRSQDNYMEKVAKGVGARRLNNRAIGGSISCWPSAGTTGDGGYAWVLQQARRPGSQSYGNFAAHPESAQAPYVARAQEIIDHAVFNDLGELGSLNPRPMQEAQRTRWSRFCSCALWEAKSADGLSAGSGWVETGTFTGLATTNSNSGAAIRYTTTVGDRKQFTIPADAPAGRVWAFGFFLNAQQDATIGVKINGVAQPDVRLQGSVLCDQGVTAKHQVITLRYGRSGGSAISAFDFSGTQLHAGDVIEFTLKTQNVANSSMSPDYAQIEADPLDGPEITVPLNHTPTNYALWASYPHGPNAAVDPMNDAAVASWNTSLAAVAAEFPGRMNLVDMSALSTKDTTLTGTPPPGDNTHWNAKGHAVAAEAIRTAILAAGHLTPRLLARAVVDPEPFFRPIGSFGYPAFLNSWTALAGSTVDQPGYYRDLEDRTSYRGWSTKTTGTTGDHVVNLSSGYRRNKITDKPFPFFNGAAWSTNAICRTDSSGDVYFILGGSVAAGNANVATSDWFANA